MIRRGPYGISVASTRVAAGAGAGAARLVFLVRFQSSTATPPADLTAGLTLPDAVQHGYITH